MDSAVPDASGPHPSLPRRCAAPLLALLVAGAVVATCLAPYWLHYQPFEDDFSLLLHSARQNSPAPLDWVRKGFSDYFLNDPVCGVTGWGFTRPLVNVSYYLESFLGARPEGPHLLTTNLLCWLASMLLLYGIARRLGVGRGWAALGMVFFGLSPCWYLALLHSSFRNTGLANCWILGSLFLLAHRDTIRYRPRFAMAGCLAALGMATHEQALMSLPVLLVAAAALSWRNAGRVRLGRAVVDVALVAGPMIATILLFRLVSTTYGTNYATGDVAHQFAEFTYSRRMALLGIHSPWLVTPVMLSFKLLQSAIHSIWAITPAGRENYLEAGSPAWRIALTAIFFLTMAACAVTWRSARRQWVPLVIFFFYAFTHSFVGHPSSRFAVMEVAFGVLVLVGAASAAWQFASLPGRIASGLACLALLAFTAASFQATLVRTRPDWLLRNQADGRSFAAIQDVMRQHPDARVVLVNDQAGTWSARSMLLLAGARRPDNEILPTVNYIGWPLSTHEMKSFHACPTQVRMEQVPGLVHLAVAYPAGCETFSFGRDLACVSRNFQRAGNLLGAAWAACAEPREGPACPPRLDYDIDVAPGDSVVVASWGGRLAEPSVRVFHGDSPPANAMR